MSIISTFSSSSTPFRSPLLPFSLPTQPINTEAERLSGTPIHFEQGVYPPSSTHHYPTPIHPFHFPPPIFLPLLVSQSSNFNVQRSPSLSEPFEASAKNGPPLRLLPPPRLCVPFVAPLLSAPHLSASLSLSTFKVQRSKFNVPPLSTLYSLLSTLPFPLCASSPSAPLRAILL